MAEQCRIWISRRTMNSDGRKNYISLEKMAGYRIALWRWVFVILLLAFLLGKPAWDGLWPAELMHIAGGFTVTIAAMGRLWCALYISGKKNLMLVDVGPYAMCRHPLYFFNLLGFIGISLLTQSLLIGVAVVVLFSLLYPSVFLKEEELLARKFPEFFEYQRCTPKLWPRPTLHRSPKKWEVDVSSFLRNAADSIWFMLAVPIVDVLHLIRKNDFIADAFVLY